MVETPASAAETQNGLVGPNETPQAFTSEGSVILAGWASASSLTRFTGANGTAAAGRAARPSRMPATITRRRVEGMAPPSMGTGVLFTRVRAGNIRRVSPLGRSQRGHPGCSPPPAAHYGLIA